MEFKLKELRQKRKISQYIKTRNLKQIIKRILWREHGDSVVGMKRVM